MRKQVLPKFLARIKENKTIAIYIESDLNENLLFEEISQPMAGEFDWKDFFLLDLVIILR